MLEASRRRIEETLPTEAQVLDVGGWGSPFPRADAVIDLLPYATRGLYAYSEADRRLERFTDATWVERDICARDPWPFSDRAFDFAVCSHVLEDVRDPLWVCSELSRVAARGYIEVPSRLEEQIFGVNGEWVGWGHHRWLIELSDSELVFLFKHHDIHGDPRRSLSRRLRGSLRPEERVTTLWWTDGIRCRERVLVDQAEIHRDLEAFVAAHAGRVPPEPAPSLARRGARRIRRRIRR